MTPTARDLRFKMLLTTAAAALMAMPGAAHAQLVDSGDLVTAEDSAGNPGQITITNPDASTANISVLAPVVIANWTQFNVPVNTTLNVSNASSAAQASLLNRVIGGGFSDIGGTINALGVNLWLINQNGILFGNNASINASSFFASTLGLTDADFFDFYEGTNLAGNGSNTLQFSAPSASTTAIVAAPGAQFVTDGSLFFAGPALNLDATFDAQGSVSFIAATNVTVSFNAGSPVGYTVGAGTTVAQQQIGGSVSGSSANFVLFTEAAVVNALLQVDANVTTTASPTANGVFIATGSFGADKPEAIFNGTVSSSGIVSAFSQGDLTFNSSLTGSQVILPVGGVLTAQDITATSGDIDLDGSVVTTGVLTAADDIRVDSPGAISLGSVRADSDASGAGSLFIGSATSPSSLAISGAASGVSVDISANGDTALGDVTSTGGLIDIDSGGGLNAGAISATGGDASVTAAGGIVAASIAASGTIDVDSTGGGNLSLGDLDAGLGIAIDTSGTVTGGSVTAGGAFPVGTGAVPGAVTFTGDIAAGSVDLQASGNLNLAGVSATNGIADLDSTGGAISANAVSATGGDASLTAAGAITTTSISATGAVDVDSTGGGALNLGTINAGTTAAFDTTGSLTAGAITAGGALTIGTPGQRLSAVTLTGDASAASVDIQTSGALNAQDIAANAGVVRLLGSSIDAGDVSGTQGITFSTTSNAGDASFGSLVATGGTVVVSGIIPNSVTVTGETRGTSVNLFGITALNLGSVTATAGSALLQTMNGTVSASDVTAIGGNIVAQTGGGGALTLGDLDATFDVRLSTLGALSAGGVNGGGALLIGGVQDPATATFSGDIRAASVDIEVTGALDAQGVASTAGGIDIDAGSIGAGAVSATGGDAALTASGAITTTSIGATGAIDVDSTAAGAVSLGNLRSGTGIALDTAGSLSVGSAITGGALTVGALVDPTAVTFTNDVSAASVDIDVVGALGAQGIASNSGAVDIDAGSIDAGSISAVGGNATLTAQGAIITGAINTSGAIDVDSLAGGAVNLGALSARGDITLDTAGTLAAGQTRAGERLMVGASATPLSATFTGNVIAASVDFDVAGAFVGESVVSTAGVIDIDAAAISAGSVSANGGDASLTAAGDVTTAAIASTSAIDVDSTGGGDLNLGQLTAGTNIALDTTGNLTSNTASAGGAFAVGSAAIPATATFTGDISALVIDIDSGGPLAAKAMTARDGHIDLAAGSVSAGALTSTDDITINSSGSVDLGAARADSDLSGTGNLAIGANALPASLTIGDAAQGVAVVLQASGAISLGPVTSTGGNVDIDSTADSISVGSVTANGGDARLTAAAGITATNTVSGRNVDIAAGGLLLARDIGATAGNVTLGAAAVNAQALTATNNIIVDALGDVALASALADSDASGSGDLVIGATTRPAQLFVTGGAQGASVDLQAEGSLALGSVTSTNGVVDIDSAAGAITAAEISATGGDARLSATGDVITTSISSTAAIAVDSSEGSLNLGPVTAGTDVALDAGGNITANSTTAGSALRVGSAALPAAVTFTGDVTAKVIDVTAAGALSAQAMTASEGHIAIDAESVHADTLRATDDVLVDTRGEALIGEARADTDGNGQGVVRVNGTTPSSVD